MTERVLIIGGSANDFGRETEGDVAAYQVVHALKQYGHEVVVVDDNPYSFTSARHDIQVIEQTLTVENLIKIINDEHITAMITSVGGSTAIRLGADILKLMGNGAPTVLGLSLPVMQATQNTKYLHERLTQLKIPTVQSRLASNLNEIFDAARDFELPVVIRPVAPMGQTLRLQVEDTDDLEEAAETALSRSITHQVNIDKSIRGYQEISMLVIRDKSDSTILIGGVEDMDPVGIHSADSIAITPIQTLPDPVYQKLRAAAFTVIRGFDVVGLLEVRFAVDPKNNEYIITRVTPYFDRTAALLVAATGYPLVPVVIRLMLGENLEDVKTPVIGANHTALLEPTMDHIVIRFPIFSFGDFESNGVKTEHRLNTVQKSVGATMGVGRSVEEALEKAIRAAHFNNRNFSPTVMNALTDNEIIEQLIHPRDNRIFVLMEALRRGYTVDELAELTKINAFYFYKLDQINKLEETVKNNAWQTDVLKLAKYYGLSDGLIARLWHAKFEEVRRYRWDNGILPTFKAFEPSAGEFEEAANQYYSTFESENESNRLGRRSVLVIGSGGFRLGDGAAASYVMAMVVKELQSQNIDTILMNNNPTDLMFMSQLGSKKYYEPLEISDVMNVIEIEQPTQVFVPGNRIKLINSLRQNGINVQVIAKEKYLPSSMKDDLPHIVINYFYDGQTIYLIGLGYQSNQGIILDQSLMSEELWERLPRPQMSSETPGLYQLIINPLPSYDENPAMIVRPMPFTMVAFLDKVTGIDWLRLVIRYMLNRQTYSEQQFLAQLKSLTWRVPRAQLEYWDADFAEHMEIDEELDNGRYAIGATYHII
ncbi:ATP-grasp domain-containing protein [Weissella paramesenteroides]|uniref:ATP-binding protein n=1 Tax=Weissella paramesenteroides TaxID=1249 RepID=UPI00123B9BA7|nr:ATP-grasp domain-containing protein [Weissella paramesenteroides]KAA8454149.1 ATP-grasp domain-containing protein [Weissella paramesenteroides]KAA8457884.1 ATP-grasp domain-containing protein [Weissella paramesenteroides]KAA8459919.1 ATP-grasp domain-containing protein [Weissella paramesenteroides]KAA8461891.1 ATP-grasp domain-containing protein [Weissella paramesenteroides]KAA8462019.1 ATP-grasp domain-containing protein [Weissella paramesenteroides]